MSDRRKLVPRSEDELDSLKHEVARELGLADDIKERGWKNLTAQETGRIGGQMVKKMMAQSERKSNQGNGSVTGKPQGQD